LYTLSRIATTTIPITNTIINIRKIIPGIESLRAAPHFGHLETLELTFFPQILHFIIAIQ
ncbi:MAG: hypothetical protein KAT74_07420, partial [Candidatus Cloacimonetes bacterium]|nr:hypothetical protein [Candidatus Cloacimonadota bacterium]